MLRSQVVCLGLAAASLIVVGCKGNFSSRGTQGNSGVLRQALNINPTTLDPAQVQDSETIDLMANVFEGLVAYDETNKLVGQLAESWTVSPDGKTYTFKIRSGVKFHNGDPLKASDVKKSWERALSPELNSPVATTYLNDILGAEELNKGTAKELKGAVAKDDTTLDVTLVSPRPYFLGKLTYPCAGIVNPKLAPVKGILKTEDAVGTGPFKISLFKSEQLAELTANKDYYLGAPQLAKIVRPVVRDAATRLNKFRNGETEMLTLEKQDIKSATQDDKLKSQISTTPRPAIYYLLLNAKKYAPFADRHVRRAMLMAIDRDRIANKILNGQPAANRWLPNGILDGDAPTGLKFDPVAAKAELAQSSFKTGDSLPELELVIRADNVDARFLADAVSADLKQHLGMKVQPRPLEWGVLLKQRNKAELPCAFLSWFGDYIDPQNFLSMLLASDASLNFDKWSNPKFDELCKQADVETDPEKRKALYRQAEQIVVDEVPRIPMYFGQDVSLISPKVSGIRKNLLGVMPHLKTVVK